MSQVEIVPYTPKHQDDCLAVYDSNCPEYFLPEERTLFIDWLNKAERQPYWVLQQNHAVIGCAGVFASTPDQPFDIPDEVGFAWGMVRRDLHKQGFGKQLALFRLKYLQAHYPNRPIVLRTSQHIYPFFEKLGFHQHQHIPNGFGQGMDKYIMVSRPSQTI